VFNVSSKYIKWTDLQRI